LTGRQGKERELAGSRSSEEGVEKSNNFPRRKSRSICMNWIWLSCVINIGNMAHLGGILSEHWLPSTACRIMRCSSHLEATFVLSLFPMDFCLLAFRAERIHIPTLAGPKNAAQQAYKRRESMIINLYCTVSTHIIRRPWNFKFF